MAVYRGSAAAAGCAGAQKAVVRATADRIRRDKSAPDLEVTEIVGPIRPGPPPAGQVVRSKA
ncbi:hypothetical protein GCM10010468_04160 [Actinocorallia longicatena]|uniref:Uncharacterized protein n=1 Tax=Actinocorallia longicatena TaxID=111803 RepID=A0ABP6PWT1_9ACTN